MRWLISIESSSITDKEANDDTTAQSKVKNAGKDFMRLRRRWRSPLGASCGFVHRQLMMAENTNGILKYMQKNDMRVDNRIFVIIDGFRVPRSLTFVPSTVPRTHKSRGRVVPEMNKLVGPRRSLV